jgi:hypothetical protein
MKSSVATLLVLVLMVLAPVRAEGPGRANSGPLPGVPALHAGILPTDHHGAVGRHLWRLLAVPGGRAGRLGHQLLVELVSGPRGQGKEVRKATSKEAKTRGSGPYSRETLPRPGYAPW